MTAEESPKIFWSWQSDYSPDTCRNFVRISLVEAIDMINSAIGVNDADRPEVDHDTKGERGMVDIASTILTKIANAAVFVADLTPIARSPAPAEKWLPNPNVMIELGWAMQKPGWERVIGVLNTATGAEIEDLPFDIRQRRVITYHLADGADPATRKSAKKKLVKELKGALEINLADRAEEIAAAATITGVPASAQNPSIWATAKDILVHNDAFGRPGRTEVRLPDVPRAYIRVTPAGWKTHPPSVADIASLHQSLSVEAPHDTAVNGDFGATEEGFVRYWITGGHGEPISSTNMTMFFDDTGEFWMLHGSVIVPHNGHSLLKDQPMLGQWSQFLRRSMAVMDRFGALAARRVEAGLVNVRDLRWYAEWEMDRIQSRRNEAIEFRQSQDWDNAAQIAYLTNAYNRVRSLFALPRIPEAKVSEILAHFDPERFTSQE
ncbi:MAG: hypothetical protein E5X67_31365 [Mesorhizobium sp.]|uniref:hypothetical protein n=1 Tax=Mesorhizobium sp. TaxID=1871066 RepID=UPI001214C652|nr:hypothetical protein [Mesorhizobium sp.]TIP23908.1 MAG: hypothetical protein E5X67_31365 [Mesorhizobium sp.]